SAGDFSAQFRFADEKEWARESLCHQQLSALSVDCQSLVQALQELPLHLRLNVPAELVQASTPAELPQMKSEVTEGSKRRELPFRRPPAPSETALVSHSSTDSVAPSEPGSKNGPRASAAEPFQRGHPPPKQATDHLDEELDFLLTLAAPVDPEKVPVSGTVSNTTSSGKDLKDLGTERKAKEPAVPEEKSVASQQQQKASSKPISEEELEDWLDSMIS
ncbi:AVEN regulator, partial [Semnornis frantzii]|nr:AVEN regulator [Semnornis frantzii]